MKVKKILSKAMVSAMTAMMVVTMMPTFAFAAEKTATPVVTSENEISDSDAYAMKNLPKNYHHIYYRDQAVLKDIKVTDSEGNLIKKPIKFRFWNSTQQAFETEVTSKDGIIPDVKMVKGSPYMVFAIDDTYDFAGPNYNAYILFADTKGDDPIASVKIENEKDKEKYSKPLDLKSYKWWENDKLSNISEFKLVKKTKSYPKTKDGRIKETLNVYHWDKKNGKENYGDYLDHVKDEHAKLIFTSQYDRVEAPVDRNGFCHPELFEDMTYSVSVKSDNGKLYTPPLTLVVKDHSERVGKFNKQTYCHYS